jgi:hypothetical protein
VVEELVQHGLDLERQRVMAEFITWVTDRLSRAAE